MAVTHGRARRNIASRRAIPLLQVPLVAHNLVVFVVSQDVAHAV
jgi:hypothetical protein